VITASLDHSKEEMEGKTFRAEEEVQQVVHE
jgi:hypothetical protein